MHALRDRRLILPVLAVMLPAWGIAKFSAGWRQEERDGALIAAVREGNAPEARRLLAHGARARQFLDVVHAPSLWTRLMRLLRRQGPLPPNDPANHLSLLAAAIKFQHLDIALPLVQHGADPNERIDGFPLLMLLINHHNIFDHSSWQKDDTVLFAAMLEHGADPYAIADNACPVLNAAINDQNLEFVRLLTAKGAHTNLADGIGNTPVYLAFDHHDPAMMKVLLDREIERTSDASARVAPSWYMAAWCGSRRALQAQLDVPVKMGMKQADIDSALRVAAYGEKADCVQLLLEHDANCNAKSDTGETPLLLAAEGDRNSGCGFNAVMMWSPGRPEVSENCDPFGTMKCLLDRGAQVNAAASDGNTALLAASMGAPARCVQLLLDSGAKMEAKNKDGETALLCAAQWGNTPVVRLLLARGADTQVRDEDGETALLRASQNGHAPALTLLLARGADARARDKNGNTALLLAASSKNLDALMLLVQQGADVNAVNRKGRTPLIEAAAQPWPEAVHRLLAKGANALAVDRDGKTALSEAGASRYPTSLTINALLKAGARWPPHKNEQAQQR